MGFSHSTVAPGTGGSGPTQNLAWQLDTFDETVAWLPGGVNLILSEDAVFADGLFITSQGQPLDPQDYTFTGPNQITIEFGADPATDTTDGVWRFVVQYQYQV